MPAKRTLRLMTIVAGGWLAGEAPARGQIPDCPAWEQKHPVDAPSPRGGHAMAYDNARRVTVLFGGASAVANSTIPLSDTWEWDGVKWSLRSTGAPSARFDSAMAYDELRGVTVLFGGVGANRMPLNDTWEWNGIKWTKTSDSGPAPRLLHALVYDSHRGVTVLFGGLGTGGHYGDTWEWNGITWALRSNIGVGPSPRRGHAMAYDHRRHVTVLYGGSSNSSETWEWDGQVWLLRSPWVDPEYRFTHTMAYDSNLGVTLLFSGGLSFPRESQTWAWDGTTWTVLSEFGPLRRHSSAMAYDSARGTTVLFGGAWGPPPYFNDTWELPSCPLDSDDDGVPDSEDECDDSDLGSTIVVDGCDSGVANHLFHDGCTMTDRIAACAEDARNHGAFVRCVAHLDTEWLRDKFITSRDHGPIQRCAAHASLPDHSNGDDDDDDKNDDGDEKPMRHKTISRDEVGSRP